jgi:hypothetical protein
LGGSTDPGLAEVEAWRRDVDPGVVTATADRDFLAMKKDWTAPICRGRNGFGTSMAVLLCSGCVRRKYVQRRSRDMVWTVRSERADGCEGKFISAPNLEGRN